MVALNWEIPKPFFKKEAIPMAESKSLDPKEVYGPIIGNRWIQLTLAVIAMIMIANLQYAWTLFVPPLRQAFGWTLAATQMGFTLFIVFETYAMPVEGYLLDRFGPRIFFTLAGIFVGVGWTCMGLISSLGALYFFYGLAGLGAGFIYGGSIAIALRWFQDKRGLAAGIIAAGFGAGSALFIPIIGYILATHGYAPAFVITGIFQGAIILIAAQLLKYPPGQEIGHVEKVVEPGTTRGYKPWEMLRQPQFYLIYFMFICMATGGLLVTAQTKPFAKFAGIASYIVILAITLDRVGNGLGRIMWGGISDKLGRPLTMALVFFMNGITVILIPSWGAHPVGFVILLFLTMLTWGPIFALFPAITADRFGTTYAAGLYGVVYTAKGFGGILGGVVSAYLAVQYGWAMVFYGGGILAFVASIGALVMNKVPVPDQIPVGPRKATLEIEPSGVPVD
jgi:OFA family oxalate/formate antiporter-like MFS transporter